MIAKHDALFHGLINLSGYGRHLNPGTPIKHTYIGPQPFCHPGTVHGCIPAADNHDIFAKFHDLTAVDQF